MSGLGVGKSRIPVFCVFATTLHRQICSWLMWSPRTSGNRSSQRELGTVT